MDSGLENKEAEEAINDNNNSEPPSKKSRTSTTTTLLDIEVKTLKFENQNLKQSVVNLEKEKESLATKVDLLEGEKQQLKNDLKDKLLKSSSSIGEPAENQRIQKEMDELKEEIKMLQNKNKQLIDERKKEKKQQEEAAKQILKNLKDQFNEKSANSSKSARSKETPKPPAEEQTNPSPTRVYAIWGKSYYSATVESSFDGLGRCTVVYTEDQTIRKVPKESVIPISLVKEGTNISILGEKDKNGERIVFEGKIVGVHDDGDNFEIEIFNDSHAKPKTRNIDWVDIFFTEQQYKQIIKTAKNQTLVDKENIIEARTRRSVASPAAAAVTPSTSKATPSSSSSPTTEPKESRAK